MHRILTVSLAILAFVVLASCATTKAPTPSPSPSATPTPTPTQAPSATPSATPLIQPDPSTIGTESSGFSPLADSDHNTITFDLSFGNANKVKAWKILIKSNSQFLKTFSGSGTTLPKNITWDGKNDNNALVSDGTFAAVLAVEYQDTYLSSETTSTNFMVGVSPPSGSIKLSQALFSPLESSDTLTLTVQADSKIAKVDSWHMKILDPAGHLFKSFEAKWPDNSVKWDGKSLKGEMVESAEDYPVELTLRDSLGNTSLVKSVIPVDILMEKTPTGYRILSSRIFFKAFTADYVDVADNLAQQNQARLDQLATRLKKFPAYKIKIVGHAVMVHWDNPKLGKLEQEKELIPLSLARANAIASALAERGVNAANLTSEGVGAADQLVPDSNLTDRWRNRRVALFLER